jgi:redox-sensitive bicupin YhaK (pirin superfamily)
MEKTTITSYGGVNANVGDLLVNRLLPNRYSQAVGPFVFLDHLYPSEHPPKTPRAPTGAFAHPHRGIATFTYLFNGSLEHYDSHGHHGIVDAGGAQWMKAGNGVMHDENPSPRFQREGGVLHALQFWVNLPAKNKAEAPDYLALQAGDIPEVPLPGRAGVLRVIIGSYGEAASPVQTFSPQLLYHVRLQPGAAFTLHPTAGWEYAAFVPGEAVVVGEGTFARSELLLFGSDAVPVTFTNPGGVTTDLILFGGEPYREPIVAQGPFVMNSQQEIATAYRDFFNGRYGKIEYKPLDQPQTV